MSFKFQSTRKLKNKHVNRSPQRKTKLIRRDLRCPILKDRVVEIAWPGGRFARQIFSVAGRDEHDIIIQGIELESSMRNRRKVRRSNRAAKRPTSLRGPPSAGYAATKVPLCHRRDRCRLLGGRNYRPMRARVSRTSRSAQNPWHSR